MMKKFVFIIMAAVVLTSCSENEKILKGNDDGMQIALRSTAINSSGVVTRVPFEGAIDTDNKLVARVISATDATVAIVKGNGTMTFNGTGAATYDSGSMETGADATAYPSYETPVYLFGLYPATGWNAPTVGSTDFTFTGVEDVMVAAQVVSKWSEVVAGNHKTLTFQHLLTKLEVKLYADAIAITRFGKIKSIELVPASGTHLVNKLTFDGSSASTNAALSVTLATATESSMDFYGVTVDTDNKKTYTETAFTGQAYELTADPTLVAYSMIAPVIADDTDGTYEYFLRIESEHATASIATVGVNLLDKDGDNFAGSTAGYSFTVKVHFQAAGEIKADVVVNPWIEGGEYTGGIEG